MSSHILEGQGTWRDRPFTCEANLGYPNGHLEIQSDITGNFTTIISYSNQSNALALIIGNWETNGTECNRVHSLKFGLRQSAVTSNLHNTKLRCVVVPSSTSQNQEAVFIEEIVKVVDSKYIVICPTLE